jgi:chromosome partitioning protein
MRIIALAQQKGGVGKTATAINLACEIVRGGDSAAVLDMDEGQWSADAWGKRRKKTAPIVRRADTYGLTASLEKLRGDGVNWAILDMPGRNSPASNAGLSAADFIIIPTRPLALDAEASAATVQSCLRAKKTYAYLLTIASAQHDKARGRRFAEALSAAGHPVSPIIIIQRVIVPDAIERGQCACEAEPKGESATEFTALFTWLKGQIR